MDPEDFEEEVKEERSESDEDSNSSDAPSPTLIRQSPRTDTHKQSKMRKRSRSRSPDSRSQSASRSPTRSLSHARSRSRSRSSTRSVSRNDSVRSRSRSRSNRSNRSNRSRQKSKAKTPSTSSKAKIVKKPKPRKSATERIKESQYNRKYLNWPWILTANGEIWLFPEEEDKEISVGKPDDVFLLTQLFQQHSRREGRDKSSNISCLVFKDKDQYYLIQPDRYFGEHPHALKELDGKMTDASKEITLSEKKSKYSLDTFFYIFFFRIY